MSYENWVRIQEIFLEAADMHPSERAAFLDRMCSGDTEARMEVESLLRADATGESAVCAAIESEVASMLDESSPLPGELLRRSILPANRAAKGRCLSLFERTW